MKVKNGLELTFAILKPHVTKVPYIVKDIRRRIVQNGFYVLRTKRSVINIEQAHEFYEEHKQKFFFNRLVTFMTSGPCYFHVLARTDAIQTWRTLMGPTKVFKTIYTNPLTIRGTHGLTDTRNATHGSDSVASAEKEIKFFFPDFDLTNWYERDRLKFINGEIKFDRRKFIHIATGNGAEMMLEEENDMFILEIREEIVEKSLHICYENYMERQAVAFTVHCAYLAWVKVINVYYMPRDQGDEEDKDVKESWEPDEEPESSIIDSWATQFMTTSKDSPVVKEAEIPSMPTAMASETARSDTIKSIPSVYFPEGEGYEDDEYGYPREFAGESLELFLPRRKSIFTRTLSMPREFLPLFEPLNLGLGQCKDETSNFKKKVPEDVFQPTYIDVSNVQSNRDQPRDVHHTDDMSFINMGSSLNHSCVVQPPQ